MRHRPRYKRGLKRKIFGIPPETKRYCLNCKKVQKFKYNATIGHSECKYCGLRFSKKPVVKK